MSADGFSREAELLDQEARLDENPKATVKNTVGERIDASTLAQLEALRDGK